jgi:hypothetical protein
MFETLFGSEMPLAARFFIAFLVVLALIGATAWLVRRFGANRLGSVGARGRQPRLAVIDAASVDGRRRLVLIRRDNIEHLLMIGGPTDLVVEPNIVRAVGSREVTREPGRIEAPARAATGLENAWPLQPTSEPTPVPAPRPYRSQATEEPWHAPEPGARARPADGLTGQNLTGQNLTGLAAELSTRLNSPEPGAQPPRIEPALRVNAAPQVTPEPAPAAAQNDHNLAEMAQQLEAALRRTPETRAPVTDPLAVQANARPPARDYKARVEPKFDSKFDTKFDSKPEPRLDSPAPAAPGKNLYDNLEEEMASLLGRPSGKS